MKNLIYTLLLLFNTASLFAQFSEEHLVGSKNTFSVNHTVILDMDTDDDLDVLFYSAGSNRFCWTENTYPENYFLPSELLIIEVDDISFFDAKDVDNDGDLDIIYSSAANNSIYWIEGLGNLEFGTSHLISDSLMNPYKFVLGDLDGDEDLEIISFSNQSNEVVWFEKLEGTPSYSEARIVSNDFTDAEDIALDDIDGDDDLDIIMCSREGGKIVWYKNSDGLGEFTPSIPIADLVDVGKIKLKDFDMDGDLDLIAGSYSLDKFVWYNNNGLGEFGAENFILAYNQFTYFDLADMDGDEDLDFLVSSFYTGSERELTWFENDNYDFSTQRILYTDKVRSFYPEDMDKDGAIDIISLPQNGLYYHKNTGAPDNFSGRILELPFHSYCDLVVGDVNNDGLNDIVTGSSAITIYETIKESPYQFQTKQMLSSSAIVYHKVDVKDIDNDNDLDILFCSQYSLGWRKNDGSGNFSAGAIIDEGEFNDFEVGDIDNDGDLDIISTSHGISFWENVDGNFETEIEFYDWSILGDEKANLELGDLDDDGDLDLVAGFQDLSEGVYWFENMDGQGLFSEPVILSSTIQCQNVKIGDLDGDSYLDIIVNKHGDAFFWFQNDGNTNFSPAKKIPYTNPGSSLQGDSYGMDIGDIDLDGDLDIVATDFFPPYDFFLLENIDGLGTFSEVITIDQPMDYPLSSELFDFDKDGDLDLFGATVTEFSELIFFKNTSTTVATEEIELKDISFTIFPNPTDNFFSIKPAISEPSLVTYQVLNVGGSILLEDNEMLLPNTSIDINTSNLPTGIFLIKLMIGNNYSFGKIIIQR